MGNQERKVRANERELHALELRKSGVSYAEIAARLGWRTRQAAHRAVKRALVRTLQEPADELRQLELQRLDAMWLALWPAVRDGNLGAVSTALRVMERRASLLGLDAPKRQDITSAGDKLTITLSLSDADEEGGD